MSVLLVILFSWVVLFPILALLARVHEYKEELRMTRLDLLKNCYTLKHYLDKEKFKHKRLKEAVDHDILVYERKSSHV
jgi:hypothetical protein